MQAAIPNNVSRAAYGRLALSGARTADDRESEAAQVRCASGRRAERDLRFAADVVRSERVLAGAAAVRNDRELHRGLEGGRRQMVGEAFATGRCGAQFYPTAMQPAKVKTQRWAKAAVKQKRKMQRLRVIAPISMLRFLRILNDMHHAANALLSAGRIAAQASLDHWQAEIDQVYQRIYSARRDGRLTISESIGIEASRIWVAAGTGVSAHAAVARCEAQAQTEIEVAARGQAGREWVAGRRRIGGMRKTAKSYARLAVA